MSLPVEIASVGKPERTKVECPAVSNRVIRAARKFGRVNVIALIQRVNWAQVKIEKRLHSEIGQGLLAFVGIEKDDSNELAEKLLEKILAYRVFADADDKMNLDVKDIGGDLMLVSQFTLAADTDNGLRPGFSSAKPPAEAKVIYDHLVAKAEKTHEFVRSGVFAADMQVELVNDGPVTFILKV